jgi:hypothetical protein
MRISPRANFLVSFRALTPAAMASIWQGSVTELRSGIRTYVATKPFKPFKEQLATFPLQLHAEQRQVQEPDLAGMTNFDVVCQAADHNCI